MHSRVDLAQINCSALTLCYIPIAVFYLSGPMNTIVINNRFKVDFDLNTIHDLELNTTGKTEPRLIKLLQLLVQSSGKMVSREYLIKEVWNDYGNADEALTQGISYLRKMLKDERKELIETVPKKGYVLHAKTMRTETEQSDAAHPVPASVRRPFPVFSILVAVFSFVAFLFAYNVFKTKSPDVIDNAARDPGSQDTVQRGADVVPDSLTRK
jgi:DNA-binding winged helix-turn-helix (wHTH) protein